MPRLRKEKHESGLLSNYCGLGGSGPTQHLIDVLCKIHDRDYQKIITQGKNPYLTHNWADEKFLTALEKLNNKRNVKENILKFVATSFFNFKQRFGYKPETAAIDLNTPELAPKRTSEKISPAQPMSKRLKRLALPAPQDFDDDMDISDNEDPDSTGMVPFAAARSNNTSKGSKETKITSATPDYGLQETHTTILPMNIWFSIVVNSFTDNSVYTGFHMTSIYDIIRDTYDTPPAPLVAGRYNRRLKQSLAAGGAATHAPFPATITGVGTGEGEAPAWRNFWAKMYGYYTVL